MTYWTEFKYFGYVTVYKNLTYKGWILELWCTRIQQLDKHVQYTMGLGSKARLVWNTHVRWTSDSISVKELEQEKLSVRDGLKESIGT